MILVFVAAARNIKSAVEKINNYFEATVTLNKLEVELMCKF